MSKFCYFTHHPQATFSEFQFAFYSLNDSERKKICLKEDIFRFPLFPFKICLWTIWKSLWTLSWSFLTMVDKIIHNNIWVAEKLWLDNAINPVVDLTVLFLRVHLLLNRWLVKRYYYNRLATRVTTFNTSKSLML